MKRAIAVLAFLAALAPSATAGEFYLGGAAGWSSVRNTLRGSVFDSDDVGYKGFAGYRFHDNVALEASYADLGNFAGTSNQQRLDANANAVAVWGVGRFPLGEIFSVWVKLGLARTLVELQVQEETGTTEETRDDTDFSWGVGVGASVGKRVTFRAEWEEYMGESAEKIQFASLGVQFNF